jgi:hypothetical protein
MRIRVGLLSALLAVGLASPQAAVGGQSVLSVKADTSGYATLELTAPTTLDSARWSLSGKGSYKVALLDRVVEDRPGAGYNLVFSDVPAMQEKPGMLGGPGRDEPLVVPPGRYRVYVASNAPALLRIPIIRGTGSRTLHIKKKSPILARFDRGTPGPDGLLPRKASIRSDLTLGNVVAFKFSKWELSRSAGPYTGEIRDCITTRDGDCDGNPVPGVGASANEGDSTHSRREYWDTFDYAFTGAASAVTEYEGTERPTSFAQLLVAFHVG